MHLTAGRRGVSPARLALSPLPPPRRSPDSRSLEKSRFLRPCPPSRPPPPSSASSSNWAQRGEEAPSARGSHTGTRTRPRSRPAPLPSPLTGASSSSSAMAARHRPAPPPPAPPRPAAGRHLAARRGTGLKHHAVHNRYRQGQCNYRD